MDGDPGGIAIFFCFRFTLLGLPLAATINLYCIGLMLYKLTIPCGLLVTFSETYANF